jgi:hypothetical protein
MRTRSLVAYLCLAAAGTALPAREMTLENSFHRTLFVHGPLDLEVATGAGNIFLRAGEPGEVRITCTVRRSDAAEEGLRLDSLPPIQQVGNVIRIGHRGNPVPSGGQVSISYDLVVPPETRLRAHTGAGEQRLEGIAGPVEAISTSGRLTLSNIGGQVRARTGVGDIRVAEIGGGLSAKTSSGSIYGSGIAGSIQAQTGVGHVRLENSSAPDVEVATSSGNVQVNGVQGSVRIETGVGHIDADGEPSGEWRLGTRAGNVQVRVPEGRGLQLHARTSSGHIEHRGRTRRREMHRRFGAGGALVHIRTGVGNIRIE